MKILQVAPHFPPRSIGGVEIYTKRLADTLLKLGDEPVVAAIDAVGSADRAVRAQTDTAFGYPVHRISAPLEERGVSLGLLYEHRALDAAVDAIVERTAPDVVHLHSGYLLGGSVLASTARRRVPTVVTLHDFWFICPRITMSHPGGALCSGPESAAKCAWCLATEKRRARTPNELTHGLLGRAIVPLLRSRPGAALFGQTEAVDLLHERRRRLMTALEHADVILSPSKFVRDQIESAGFPAGRIQLSRYGIETDAARPGVPDTEGRLRLAYLGQIAPHKGVHLLIRAVRQLTGLPLDVRVYGDPAPHAKYAQELRRLASVDSRVTFPGPYRHADVYDILANTDVIVVPSVWYENAPFVIQEAHAAGVPVIASRLGGMRELVQDEADGLLFEPADAAALARQIQRFATDQDLRVRLRPSPGSVRTATDEIVELRGHYRRLSPRTVHEFTD
jgi:glycosyltransferase involved in cell wall biosynthesis